MGTLIFLWPSITVLAVQATQGMYRNFILGRPMVKYTNIVYKTLSNVFNEWFENFQASEIHLYWDKLVVQ